MTSVTIIGAGNMARTIVAGGPELQILAPTVEHATSLSEDLASGGGSVTDGGTGESLTGDVVVLAAPYDGALDFASSRAHDLTGKVVVDITNPVDWTTFDRLVTPADSSAAEEIAKQLPAAHVVRAFDTTFAGTLNTGEVRGQQLDVFLASDDDDAKARIVALVQAGGMRAIDAGPLRRARELERMGFLHMALQDRLGTGFGTAIKVVTA